MFTHGLLLVNKQTHVVAQFFYFDGGIDPGATERILENIEQHNIPNVRQDFDLIEADEHTMSWYRSAMTRTPLPYRRH